MSLDVLVQEFVLDKTLNHCLECREWWREKCMAKVEADFVPPKPFDVDKIVVNSFVGWRAVPYLSITESYLRGTLLEIVSRVECGIQTSAVVKKGRSRVGQGSVKIKR